MSCLEKNNVEYWLETGTGQRSLVLKSDILAEPFTQPDLIHKQTLPFYYIVNLVSIFGALAEMTNAVTWEVTAL